MVTLFWAILKGITFEVETVVAAFGKYWATFYSNIWSH